MTRSGSQAKAVPRSLAQALRMSLMRCLKVRKLAWSSGDVDRRTDEGSGRWPKTCPPLLRFCPALDGEPDAALPVGPGRQRSGVQGFDGVGGLAVLEEGARGTGETRSREAGMDHRQQTVAERRFEAVELRALAFTGVH